MALVSELDIKNQGPLTDESRGKDGEVIRDYDPDAGVNWRFGKPNYARVNKFYFEHRSKVHEASSLEAIVQKVVKNWEVESHHIADPGQWKTMDSKAFKASVNGGPTVDAAKMAEIGPYNMLVGDNAHYSGSTMTFEQANTLFSTVFPEGYAFEVLQVHSGPPNVAFTWRHFGRMSGTFTDKRGCEFAGNGEISELYGMCVAKVDEKLVIKELEVYYDPHSLLRDVTTPPPPPGRA